MGWFPIEYQILWKSVKWLSVWINGTTHRQYGHLVNYLSSLWGREGAYSCNGLIPLSFHGPIENTQQCYKTFILFTFILFFHHKLQSVQGFLSSGMWCCAVGWVVPKVLNHLSSDIKSHLKRPSIFSNTAMGTSYFAAIHALYVGRIRRCV